MTAPDPALPVRSAAVRSLFWAAVWCAVALVAVKAFYLGVPSPATPAGTWAYIRSLAAISYSDVLFAGAAWTAGRLSLILASRSRLMARGVTVALVGALAGSCLYAVASVVVFGAFGGFVTYPLLELVGDVQMLGSSVLAYLTPRVVGALLLIPLTHLGLVALTLRLGDGSSARRRLRRAGACAVFALWLGLGHLAFGATWATRQDRRIAENAHWVLVSSWWRAVTGQGIIEMPDAFGADDLADFAPVVERTPTAPPIRTRTLRPVVRVSRTRPGTPPRALNVILVVLESVASRWTSLGGGPYDSTPALKAATGRGIVFDNFYAHIGRSSNSLTSILLSAYPKIGFRDMTEEYPRLAGTSLASVFRDHGYRTGFVTSSDLRWAGWDAFFQGRGFEQVRDHHDLTCTNPVSSWGVEDRCAIEDMLDFVHRDPDHPFFLMAWTQQTHHPYEPTPGLPLVDFHVPPSYGAWDLGRYLNVVHETDHQIDRLFDTLRREGLDQDTLVVVTGDHGQAFGDPHPSWGQGRTVYEEDVHVPLLLWLPSRFPRPERSAAVGSHVDLAPTIAGLAGLPLAGDWQGRSLFEAARPPRAYFYVAEDEYTLGVREDHWKYILNLREGSEELYDLSADPTEQHNLAPVQQERTARLRRRLAAWAEIDRRRYGQPANGL